MKVIWSVFWWFFGKKDENEIQNVSWQILKEKYLLRQYRRLLCCP